MGSILSFPILCLANAALYLETIKEDPRTIEDKLAGVLVNGDDMLYVAPSSMWKVHVANGKRVGLTMSPGKAYHHPVYANANSACYHFDLRQFKTDSIRRLTGMKRVAGVPTPKWSEFRFPAPRSSLPYSIPFLNVGLYFGQNKVLGGDDVDSENKSLSSTINRLIEGALPGKAADLLAMYIGRHKMELNRECAGRNLFLPQSLGGMGVNPVEGFVSTKVTLAQRALAKQMMISNPFATLEQYPLNQGHFGTLPEAPQPLRAPWLAGITFSVDEDGKYNVDDKAEKPNVIAGKLRSFQRRSKFVELDLASNASMRFGLTISSAQRSGVPYVHRPPTANAFQKRTARDTVLAYLEELTDTLNKEPTAQLVTAEC